MILYHLYIVATCALIHEKRYFIQKVLFTLQERIGNIKIIILKGSHSSL